MHLHVHCGVIYNSQDMETAYLSIDVYMDKGNVYIYTKEYWQPEKEENLAFYNNMEKLESIMLSKIILTQKIK